MGVDRPASRYAAAGVDRGRAAEAVARVAELAATTWLPPLAAGIGPFAAVWRLPADLPRGAVLVSSTDSVGTKTKLAVALHRHRGIGEDIVNHCVNDVLTTGAEPLFFLDYFATGRIDPEVLAEVAAGMAAACLRAGCSLVGGETAEMPGVYGIGDYDLAGFLVGMAVEDQLLGPARVRPGDVLVGLPSSGLHTNGYTLVRQLVAELEIDLAQPGPGGQGSLGEELLTPHRPYLAEVRQIRELGGLHALAHITGGGIQENLARVLPEGTVAEVRVEGWTVPPLFREIQRLGRLAEDEMWRTFNMGVGMICVMEAQSAARAVSELGCFPVGEVTAGTGRDRVVLA